MEEYISSLIPISIIKDKRMSSLEKLLLMHIVSLCKNKGYCWATNNYFEAIYSVSKQTISRCINNLASLNYINLKYDNKRNNNSKRIITISPVLKNTLNSIKNNLNTSIKDSFKQYNKNNIKEIYTRDELGNEYWNGDLISGKSLTEDDQKELKRLIEKYK